MMDFLDFVNVVGIVGLSVWLVLRLRRWTRSDDGRARLLGWSPAAVISAQAVVAMIWVTAVVTSPWSLYFLYQAFGGWSVIPMRLMVAAILILIPCTILFCDAAWVRLHRIPVGWTLPRIWVAGLIVFIASLAAFTGKSGLPAMTVFVVLTFANLLTTFFLTAWWFVSHPLPAE
jgi:hypothetical protein